MKAKGAGISEILGFPAGNPLFSNLSESFEVALQSSISLMSKTAVMDLFPIPVGQGA